MANQQAPSVDQLTRGIGRLDISQMVARNAKYVQSKGGVKPEPAPKMDYGTIGQQASVHTNVYPMKVPEGTKVHFYKIKVEVSSKLSNEDQRWFDITAERKNEVDSRNFVRMAFDVVAYVVSVNVEVFPRPNEVVYDGRANLYSFNHGLEVRDNDVTVLMFDSPNFTPMKRPYRSAKITIERLPRVADLSNPDDPYIQSMLLSLEALTSQSFMKNRDNVFTSPQTVFLSNPSKYGFTERDFPELPAQSEVGIGAHKTCKFVSASGKPTLATIIKTKKSPFYVQMPIIEKVLNCWPDIVQRPFDYMDDLNDMLTGLVMQATHRELTWPVQIKRVVSESAKDKVFTLHDHTTVTVEQYFKTQYQIVLKYPQLPLIEVGARGREMSYHPMELYFICSAQRVKNRHLHHVTAQLIKACALLPQDVHNQMPKVRQMFDFDNNEQMNALGIEVKDKPAQVPARRLPAPGLQYRNRSVQVDDNMSSWKNGAFVLPRQDIKWAIYSLQDRCVLQHQGLIQFAKAFIQACADKGVNLGEPGECKTMPYRGKDELEAVVRRAKVQGKVDMVMFVTEKKLKIQDFIKQFEQNMDIITQNLTVDTAMNAAGINRPPKRLTMENLACKFNMKIGGLNYRVVDSFQRKAIGENDLFIGITFNRPSPGTYEAHDQISSFDVTGAPNVVAYMANDLNDTIAFTGDYIYQHPKDQEVRLELMERIITEVVKRFVTNRGRKPQNVFIYRYGLAESLYEHKLAEEIPMVKKILSQLELKNLVYIAALKNHGVDFLSGQYRGGKAPDQNLPYGVVVDKVITHPKLSEFFLLAHTARLGTARVPKYTVLANEPNLSMDVIQTLTYSLCFAHQIVATSTSLPTPIYCAEALADRARRNWNSSAKSIMDQASSAGRNETEDIYEYVTLQLGHRERPGLRNVRFNA